MRLRKLFFGSPPTPDPQDPPHGGGTPPPSKPGQEEEKNPQHAATLKSSIVEIHSAIEEAYPEIVTPAK